jgi:hypothetical protein
VLSSITFPVTAGTTYYLMAAEADTLNPTGGMLILHLNFTDMSHSVGFIQLSAGSYSVNENGGTVTITGTRTGGSSGAVGVSYATSNGTAIAGSDYTAASGALSWANGDASNKTFSVTINNDALDEPDETFTITLSSATGGATLWSPAIATVTITDDDPTPIVQFSAASSNGSEATTPAAITVTLSAASGQTVNVNYATTNGTALAGSDYTTTSGTLTFNPGDTSKTINVPIINDTAAENDETFTVTLSVPVVNATLGTTTVHTYIINDNDQNLPVLRIYGINGDEAWYSTIQSAYNASSSTDGILTLASSFSEDLNFSNNVSISLQGGYDSNFNLPTGFTIIRSLKISNGTVLISNVILQ